jgi:hypothetical protein
MNGGINNQPNISNNTLSKSTSQLIINNNISNSISTPNSTITSNQNQFENKPYKISIKNHYFNNNNNNNNSNVENINNISNNTKRNNFKLSIQKAISNFKTVLYNY